jgi:DNA replication protein DnaC
MARKIAHEAADELQALVHKRYKLRRSILIISNRVISDWDKYLGDSALTTTILDRLMHRSVLLEFKGRSYRLKQAASRLANDDNTL